MAEFKSEKKGSNIICRVSNATPEMVCRYVQRLPKQKMSENAFRNYMGPKWFQNEHQAPEQWGLYYIDGENYYPRFDRDITFDEAERYLYGWIKRLIVINPYTRFKASNDNRLVESIVKQLEINPNEHNLRKIIGKVINSDEPFVLNEILANAINNYSEVLRIDYDRDHEIFYAYLLPNYKEILKTKYNMTKKEYFDLFNDINTSAPLDEPRQIIYFGAPGTGKSFRVEQITEQYGDDVIRTTFHPDSDYSTFVGCYKPSMESIPQTYTVEGKEKPIIGKDGEQVTKEEIVYSFVPQAFTQAYTRAWLNPDKPIFLVIEELNRGNCAQIFGDIFQLLDRNANNASAYSIIPDHDLQQYLAAEFKDAENIPSDIKEAKAMRLPANLYIWATMNTSDQSLFPIDSAFKRRWIWKYIPIANAELGYKIQVGNHQYDWWTFVEKVNGEIEGATKSEDKKLGYFFAKADNNIIAADTFVSKVVFYLWNDVFKDSYDKTIFKNDLTFHKFFLPNGDPKTEVIDQFMHDLDLKADGEE